MNYSCYEIKSDSNLVIVQNGAVSSEQIKCSEIGVSMLKKGGSAVDAAIAAELCIGVINSHSAGVGGGGFILIRDSNGTSQAIDFRETAPGASTKLMYKNNPLLSQVGGLSVGVPGEIRGLELAHKNFGKLKWETLFEPSIVLSKRGFKVPPELAKRLKEYKQEIESNPDLSAIYAPYGTILNEGDIVKNYKLARTLKLLSKFGSEVFYNGKIAQSIVKKVRATNGIITSKDLKDYQPIVTKPITGFFNGGPILLAMLNILERYRLSTEDYAALIQQNISDVKDHGTTHISVVDKNNQSVSLTSTVNIKWGSQVMDPDTGILLNDEMDDFSTPGVSNYFGLKPSPYNYIAPNKRPLSSCVPVIIEKDGEFEMAIGGSGGTRILSSVLQVSMEYGYPNFLIPELLQRGHEIKLFNLTVGLSGVHAVVKQQNQTIFAAGDFRKHGVASGY
ncbi:5335_t:CDS:10 [Entrophospora sp. SA101]|nr:5335_t:CDS:10 [Entrophospora sp. SA101]